MLCRGRGEGAGISTFCPKFLSKTTPPGQRILSKNAKIPTQGQGSYIKCSYPEAMLLILGIHRDQTRQKNCTSLVYKEKLRNFKFPLSPRIALKFVNGINILINAINPSDKYSELSVRKSDSEKLILELSMTNSYFSPSFPLNIFQNTVLNVN